MTPSGVAGAGARGAGIGLEPLVRGVVWANQRLRPADGWLSVPLLALNLTVVVWSVEKADWAPTPSLVSLILLAMLTGLVLSRIRLWAILVLPVGLAIGGWVIAWQLTSFQQGDIALANAGELWRRLDLWFKAAVSGNISLDPVPFAFILVTFAWLAGYLAAWVFFRYQVFWPVFVLGGAGLLSNLTFLPPSASLDLGLYLFTAILLIARVQSMRRLREWRRRNIQFDGHLPLQVFTEAGFLAVLALLVAFLLPVGGYLGPTHDAYELMRSPLVGFEEDFHRLFAGLPARRPLPYRIWGDTMAFQGTIRPTTTPVLQVNSRVPMYWKARSYGTYSAKGWISEDTVLKPLDWAPTYASSQPYAGRFEVSYQVTPSYASQSLFAGGQIVGASRDVLIETHDSPIYVLDLSNPETLRELPPRLAQAAASLGRAAQGSGLADTSDEALDKSLPQQFRLLEVSRQQGRVQRVTLAELLPERPDSLSLRSARGRVKPKQTYELNSSVSVATPGELRRAGADYPTWVLVKYTQLPDQLPSRVRDLARQLTGSFGNPYDKAKAIEAYFSDWPYTLEVTAPPFNADGVDHFLFTQRRGYSEYYGSAMTVLLRSVGVPARLATGYTVGDKVVDQDIYLVNDSHSHAWVEVFFPNYGWIPFEPTPGRDLPLATIPGLGPDEFLLAPGKDQGLADQCDSDLDEEECEDLAAGLGGANSSSWANLNLTQKLLRVLPGVVAFLAIVFLLAWSTRLFWRRYLLPSTDPQAIFRRLARLGGLAAVGPLAYETPYRYGQRLNQALPAYQRQVSTIVDSYVRSLYGRKELTYQERAGVLRAWLALRPPLLRRIFRRRN